MSNRSDILNLVENKIYNVDLKQIHLVFEYEIEINSLITKNLGLNWKISRINSLIKAIIFNAIILINFCQANKKIVIDQSLNLIKKFFWNQEYKYVNAIIHNCTK